jgi:4-oxalocrotonate tautomerase
LRSRSWLEGAARRRSPNPLFCGRQRAGSELDLINRPGAQCGTAQALSESRFHNEEPDMPTIRVELMEGRTPEQKKNLVSALTRAVVETLGTKPEAVDVLLFDVKRGDWATGGVLWSERK